MLWMEGCILQSPGTPRGTRFVMLGEAQARSRRFLAAFPPAVVRGVVRCKIRFAVVNCILAGDCTRSAAKYK